MLLIRPGYSAAAVLSSSAAPGGTMIKHILVPSNGLEANLLEDAFKLASPFSAHVDVLHVGWETTREMHFYDNGLSPDMLDIPGSPENPKILR
jgi:hypothetical protein